MSYRGLDKEAYAPDDETETSDPDANTEDSSTSTTDQDAHDYYSPPDNEPTDSNTSDTDTSTGARSAGPSGSPTETSGADKSTPTQTGESKPTKQQPSAKNQEKTSGQETITVEPRQQGPTPEGQGVEKHGSKESLQLQGGGWSPGEGMTTWRDEAQYIENQVVEETGRDPEDVSVFFKETESGAVQPTVQYTEQGLAEATAKQVREDYGLPKDAVTVSDDTVQVDRDAIPSPQAAPPGRGPSGARGAVEPGVPKEPGSESPNSRTELDSGSSPARGPDVPELGDFEGVKGDIEGQLEAQTGADFTREDIRFETEEVDGQTVIRPELTESGQRKRAVQGGREEFGDYQFQVPYTDKTFEEFARGASYDYSNLAEQAGGLATGGYGELLEQGLRGEEINVQKAVEAADESKSQTARTLEHGAKGAVEITNVPALAVTVKETGEYGYYATDRTLEGEGGAVLGATGAAAVDRGQKVYEFAQENPAEFGGMAAGSLIGSTAIMGAAGRISSRAGLASRLAIQPGEEIVGYGGYYSTKAATSARTAQRLFPNKEPLIFSEEAALRTAKAVGKKAKGTMRTDLEIEPSPHQQELIERFRPGTAGQYSGELEGTGAEGSLASRSHGITATGRSTTYPRAESTIESGEGAPGAVSEPLGSSTESILDATVGMGPAEGPSTPREVESPTSEGTTDIGPSELEGIAREAQAKSELQRAVDQIGVNVREFAAEERAQTSMMPRGRRPGGRELQEEAQEPSFDDVRQDALTQYQDYLGSQRRAEMEAEREQFADFETEAERRQEQATRPEARVYESEIERDAIESRFRTQPGADIGADIDLIGRQAQRFELDQGTIPAQEPRVGPRQYARIEPQMDTLTRLELESRLKPRFELETEPESEPYPFEFETEPEPEPELELEPEPEPELEPPIETEFKAEVRAPDGDEYPDRIGRNQPFGVDYENPIATSAQVLGFGKTSEIDPDKLPGNGR